MAWGMSEGASATKRAAYCVLVTGVAVAVSGFLDWLIGGDMSVTFLIIFAAFIFGWALLASHGQRGSGATDGGARTAHPFTRGEWLALGGCALTVVLSLVVINLSQAPVVLVIGILLDLGAGVGVVLVHLHHQGRARQDA